MTTTPIPVDELVEEYGLALRAAAKATAAEAAADDARKIVMAKEIIAAGDMAVTKAENIARASQPYINAVNALNDARREAEEARAEVEYLRVRWETFRTKTSAQKARMQHG